MRTLDRVLNWLDNHSIFVFGGAAALELLYLLENHLKDN